MRFLLIMTALAACGGGAHAQAKDDLSFRRSLPSARSVALGEAFVADVGDAASASSNPAGLAFIESFSATATGGLRTDDRLGRSELSMPVAATENATLALAGEYAAFGRTDWRKWTGTMAGGGIAYAFRILSPFSVGLVYNYRMAEFGAERASSHTGGIGLMYSVLPSLTYGVSLTGLGSGLVLKRTAEGSDVLTKESSIPRSVTFGASWRYPATHDRPILALYLSNESITGEDRLVYRMGVEVSPWKFIALRGGIVSGPVTAMGRAGIGIDLGIVGIDYAVASSVAAERMQFLTVSVPLSSQ